MFTNEQAEREYITNFLSEYGAPFSDHIWTITKGDEANRKHEPLDGTFQPESAVIHLIPKGGDWMDGQCYDVHGYKVYAD